MQVALALNRVAIVEVESFAVRLRARRLKMGLTQEQLAEKIGIAQGQYSRYEKGQDPKPELIKRMCIALECTSDFLLGLVDRPSDRLSLSPDQRKLLELHKQRLLPHEVEELLGDPNILDSTNNRLAIPSPDETDVASQEEAPQS